MTWSVTQKALLEDPTRDVPKATFTVPTFTPSNNKLYLLLIWSTENGASVPNISSVTFNGGGLTWTAEFTKIQENTQRAFWVYRALATTGASGGTTTITYASATADDTVAVVYEVDEDTNGVDLTGTQGSGAIGSSASLANQSSALNGTVTIGAFEGSGSATFAIFGITTTDTSATPETNWTALYNTVKLYSANYGATQLKVAEWRDAEDTTAYAEWDPAGAWCGAAFEIKKGSGVSAVYGTTIEITYA